MRRPSGADKVGRTVSRPCNTLFASKPTTLSTVPGSPAKSVASAASNAPGLSTHPTEVVDVDMWESTTQDKGKGKAVDERPRTPTEPKQIEFFVPLAGEPTMKNNTPPQISPSRRASQLSLALSETLSKPRSSTAPQGRSVSLSHLHVNPRTPVQTRRKTNPPPAAPVENNNGNDAMGGKRMNAKMPGSLDVLKECVIYVDVRTDDGEDAGALFVDMLRGLGARVMSFSSLFLLTLLC